MGASRAAPPSLSSPRALAALRRSWRELAAGEPGRRFQEMYRRGQSGRSLGRKLLVLGGGVLLVAAGIASFPVPAVPSDLLILLGIALASQESPRMAHSLDRLELRLQPQLRWAARGWRRLPRALRVLLALLWMGTVGLAGYGVHRLVAGG